LHPRDPDALDRELNERSDPFNAKYGKWMARDELFNFVRQDEGAAALAKWLADNKVEFSPKTDAHPNYITVSMSVNQAESLFQTSFQKYQVDDSRVQYKLHSMQGQTITRCTEYTVPDDVAKYMIGAFPIASFPTPQKKRSFRPVKTTSVSTTPTDGITPAKLWAAYGMTSSDTIVSQTNATQGVFESESYIITSDITAFQTAFGLKTTALTSIVGNNPPSSSSTDYGEATLDVEYLFAMAQNAPTTYYVFSSYCLSFFLLRMLRMIIQNTYLQILRFPFHHMLFQFHMAVKNLLLPTLVLQVVHILLSMI